MITYESQYGAYESRSTFGAAQVCDIYSLGITGIELIIGSREIDSLNRAWVFNGELKNLLLKMISTNPDERPTALQVAAGIKTIEKSLRTPRP